MSNATPSNVGYDDLVKRLRGCTDCGDAMVNTQGCNHPSSWGYLTWRGQQLSARRPKLLVVGQYPAGLQNCDATRWMPGETNPTNINLRLLLEETGLEPADVHLTNAVLCLKRGTMTEPVPGGVQANCRSRLAETIDMLKPRAVVALGGNAWRALGALYGFTATPLKTAVGSPPSRSPSGLAVFSRYHCGRSGSNPARGGRAFVQQRQDWREVGAWLREEAQAVSAV